MVAGIDQAVSCGLQLSGPQSVLVLECLLTICKIGIMIGIMIGVGVGVGVRVGIVVPVVSPVIVATVVLERHAGLLERGLQIVVFRYQSRVPGGGGLGLGELMLGDGATSYSTHTPFLVKNY